MDLFGFPDGTRSNIQKFYAGQVTGATTSWQTWYKPRGISMVGMVCVGSGAGGGGGRGAAAGGAAGGGGSGGGSGVSRYLFPAFVLPDNLYVLVGSGGPGGAGGSSANGGTGTAGQLSYVGVYPNITAQNLLAISGAAAATAGGGGTNAAAGTAGAASTIATSTGAVLSQWAVSQIFVAGVIGLIGGSQAGAAGSDVTIGTGCLISGAASGAGKTSADFAGGGTLALASTPFIAIPGGPAGGNNGGDGFWFKPHPFVYGPGGGGASNSTTGGAGGNGIFGSGGAGGGGGVTVGGAGGAGGDGTVIFYSW